MLATFPDQVLMAGDRSGRHRPLHRDDVRHDDGRGGRRICVKPGVGTGPRSLLAAGAMEDNEMSEGVQRGLHAGANTFVEFGRHESALGHFHATLDERLEWSR